MSDEQIKTMAERFLSWPLPDDFNPDGGVSFQPVANAGTPDEYHRQTTGTNLFSYTQAVAMVRHMLATAESVEMTDEQRAEVEAMRLAIKKAFYAGFDAARSANVNEAWESSGTRQAIDAAALRARAAS